MKNLVLVLAILSSAAAFAAPQTLATREYVDKGDAAVASTIDLKRGKDDLNVYRKVGQGNTWTLVSYDKQTVTEAIGEFREFDSETGGGEWVFTVKKTGEYIGSSAGELTDFRVTDYAIEWQGAPEFGYWGYATRAIAYEPVSGDMIATMSAVTNAARAVVNSVWDPQLGVAWQARMHKGALYYVAVTNRPPENK